MACVRNLLNGFHPDIVVSLFQNTDYYELAEKYCREEKIPLYLVVHDINDDFEKVLFWAKRWQLRKDRRVYRFAKERFCISPEMAKYNEMRFGVPGKVQYPIPDPEIRARPLEFSRELRQPPHLTLGYAGATAYGYGEMMVKMLPVLEQAGLRLELCCPKPSGRVATLLECPVVKWHGYQETPAAAIRLLQKRCDVLWLPYLDPAGSYERLYSTHFPSKLADYAAAGMPVWVSGPECATGLKWWRQQSGMKENLLSGLKKLNEKPELRLCLAQKMQTAGKAFSADNFLATLLA